MPRHLARRCGSSALLIAFLTASLGVVSARAQTSPACQDNTEETPEEYGPTDINAVSGNQKMSVAVNEDATVTVLKWPSPSYYDQIKYRTVDRSEPRLGALPNEGAFVGLGYRKGSGPWRFDWLRSWPSRQRFEGSANDEIVTVYRKGSEGLKVVLRDVVAHDRDAFVRHVQVSRSASSRVTQTRVIAFANFNPVFSKTARSPTDDWCTEEDNDEGAAYVEAVDAIVHSRSGVDESTGEPSGASLTMAFDGASSGHQVGADTYETGSGEGSAYDDASDSRLSGDEVAPGQADTAIADDLSLRSKRRAATTILMTAAVSQDEAFSSLREMRSRAAPRIRRDKAMWWKRWLDGARLPKKAPAPVMALAKRSLISLRQVADPRGLIVTSVATQAPLGLDWIRDGAYINRALEMAGHPDMVARHNRRYEELQATFSSKPEGGETTPPGNWAQNYYADGVVGGPIPYEIDETGFGIFTLWDHFTFAPQRDYLEDVYEAIQRAAVYLTDDAPLGCRDPTTGLQCSANEGDNPQPTRTLVGAQAVYMGLDAAVKAAREFGTDTSKLNAERWAQRRDEIKRAIKQNFFDKACNCYTKDYETGGTTLWPAQLEPYGSAISDAQAEANWQHIARAMAGKVDRGRLESRALVGNAYAWAQQPRKLRRVKKGLVWVARSLTTPSTRLLGEAWMRYPNERSPIVTMVSQPHVWNQSMFYLAALKAYGSTRWKL